MATSLVKQNFQFGKELSNSRNGLINLRSPYKSAHSHFTGAQGGTY